ncbi:STAS domain-containing protein [bacterium]|nr:STAS domain-containing protein [bacterium]
MSIEQEDYRISHEANNVTVISGVLRLQSPMIYDDLFAPLHDAVSRREVVTLDISDVSFLNSSGITALARLIIHARNNDIEFNILCKEEIPWQKKSIASLKRLWPRLEIKLT